MVTKQSIIDELDALPLEALIELQTFIEFLRFKSEKHSAVSAGAAEQTMWLSALQGTSGMWADRDDVPGDGVLHVQNIRQGHRLNDL
jgi:hypothetical protein